jgi:hypothetical protein
LLVAYPKKPYRWFLNFSENYAEEMLTQLEAEIGVNSEIYTDDKPSDSMSFADYLYGVHAATKMSDIINQNIQIELVNSQIKMNLKQLSTGNVNSKTIAANLNEKLGKKTSMPDQQPGYVIMSAAKANLFHRIHKPVLKSQRVMDKSTWIGHVSSMQYFATLPSKSDTDTSPISNEDYWLDETDIDPDLRSVKNDENSSEAKNLGIYKTYFDQISYLFNQHQIPCSIFESKNYLTEAQNLQY